MSGPGPYFLNVFTGRSRPNDRVLTFPPLPSQEFAENLLNGGVHGAVMVLDPTFNTEAMATALGIPGNKHMVRRHLVEEMQTLIGSAW